MARIAITGVGVVSPFGRGFAPFWENIAAGRSAIGPVTQIELRNLVNPLAAQIKDWRPEGLVAKGMLNFADRHAQFALVAAREAVADSGVAIEGALKPRTACIIGTGIGSQSTQEENYAGLFEQGRKRPHPFVVPRSMTSVSASLVSMAEGAQGPTFVVSTACASAAHAIGLAMMMLRGGLADVAICGGSEATLQYGPLKGWEGLRVLARDTCRPFARTRSGLVMGEGAAMFVLETEAHARARGARVRASLAGFGMNADAGDIVQPTVEGPANAMALALADAGFAPQDVEYINAHGTGTAANDRTETAAIKQVFGDHARALAISATKSMHGHTLGGTAALELAAIIGAIENDLLPPTANYDEPDPELDLDYVPNTARAARIDVALSNSFAFGGVNAALVVTRPGV